LDEITYLCNPEYKFIPLFELSLGMGYTFIIGYDILINNIPIKKA
jgi:hypothetical protein